MHFFLITLFAICFISLVLYTFQMIKKVQKMRSSGSTSFKSKFYYRYYLKHFVGDMPD